jgi:hypothetical protein
MMKDGTVYCIECLNTGKYLHAGKTGEYVARGTREEFLTEDMKKGRRPKAHFGR